MRKLSLLVAIGVLSVGFMVGCGDSKDDATTAATTAAATEADTEEATEADTDADTVASDADATDEDVNAGDEEVADISGEWKLTIIQDAEGNQSTLEEYCAAQGVDSAGVEAIYNFDGNGTTVASIGGIGVEGTYTFDGTTIAMDFTATEGGQKSEMQYDAENDIIFASDANTGMTSIMERQ